MTKSRFSTAAFLLVLVAALPGHALEWATLSRQLKADPLQRAAEVTFPFVNRSPHTVTITSVDVSCDCVHATPSAPSIAPGAAGEIRAQFSLADRFGTFQRTIVVSTDEAGEPTVLSVDVTVPEVAIVSPRSAEWQQGDPLVERVVNIDAPEGITLAVRDVQSTSGSFTFRLVTDEAGRRYRLLITPVSTAQRINAAFRIFARANDRDDVLLNAYANVR